MLQNRVTPQGDIIATAARGAWMGNRGQLHDSGKDILRPFKLKAWLICLLQFNGRKRQVMAPNRYTELFFLDEATAFAAGHRPCFECRRAAYSHFKTCWLQGNPQYGFSQQTPIQKIDEILHHERINSGQKVTYTAPANSLPNGTFILMDNQPCMVANNHARQWMPTGYGPATTLPAATVTVLTPQSTVNAFRAGYRPQMALPA